MANWSQSNWSLKSWNNRSRGFVGRDPAAEAAAEAERIAQEAAAQARRDADALAREEQEHPDLHARLKQYRRAVAARASARCSSHRHLPHCRRRLLIPSLILPSSALLLSGCATSERLPHVARASAAASICPLSFHGNDRPQVSTPPGSPLSAPVVAN